MTDADLLDLLEILGDINEAIASLPRTSGPSAAGIIANKLAERKIQSFRSAIRQRMNHKRGEV